jgi:hypothetical protein
MKTAFLSRSQWKRFVSLVVIVVVIVSLADWTVFSPVTLTSSTSQELHESVFQFVKATSILNITDGEGAYSFLLGLDYNDTVSTGLPSIVVVYISLLNEQKNNGFLRGVSLQVVSSRVLVDGVEYPGVKSEVSFNSAILTDRLSGVEINDTAGSHRITARLILSTVDVNYIGYLGGSEKAINLNGTITVL